MNLRDKIMHGVYVCVGCIGAIHSGASSIYENPGVANLIEGYQNDVTSPIGAYFALRFVNKDNPIQRAGLVFSVYSGLELIQGITNIGTFDPKDFIAYAAGTLLAVGLEKITFKE